MSKEAHRLAQKSLMYDKRALHMTKEPCVL